ncbi:MAG TPA: hypothetical protein VMW24_21410 [Sedimentisphaerales bacterium]|nr:hypothetical protein [Sedimentisphaerales bacterium]
MAINTYAALLTAVSDYIGKRTDLGDVDDDFVILAEARLNYGDYGDAFATQPLRVRQMEARATASPTGEYIALPTDFLEIKALKDTAANRALQPVPSGMFDKTLSSASSGAPVYYDIVGGEIRLNPVSSSATLEILYYQSIPPLASNDPNWLLTANPAVYLYGCLLEAAIYIDENEDIAKYGNLYAGLLRGMQMSGSDSGRGQPMAMQSGVVLAQSSRVRI